MNLDEGEAAAGTSSPTDAATSKNLKSEKKVFGQLFQQKKGNLKVKSRKAKA